MKNWYKIAQGKMLYVMRGISGSGKSTAAKSLPGVVPENIFSTDNLIASTSEEYSAFFDAMAKAEDWSPLAEKHKELVILITEAMRNGKTPVVLDNMNLAAWESKAVIREAINNGYKVEIVDVGTGGQTAEQLAKRNSHGVPIDAIEKMIDKYESEGPLTVEKVLESEPPQDM